VTASIAVLGAGAMGGAAARLLARRGDIRITVLDGDVDRARSVAEQSGPNAVAACIPYRLNIPVMEACLAAGVHYADLGGLFHTTLEQLSCTNASNRRASRRSWASGAPPASRTSWPGPAPTGWTTARCGRSTC
jgi:glycine/D-amino acid oxidase-like deaminating enzyme